MARIFLIESYALDIAHIGAMLKRLSHEVISISPAQAIQNISYPPPDLVLVGVPAGEETATIHAIDEFQFPSTAPIIYVAAPESLPALETVEEPPAVVTKPVNELVLDAVIRGTLRCHKIKKKFQLSNERLKHLTEDLIEAQALSTVGSWEENLVNGELHVSEMCLRMHGFTSDASLHSSMELLAYANQHDRAQVSSLLEQARATGKPYAVEYQISLPGGPKCTVHQRVSVQLDAAGKPKQILCTVQDITEQKRNEEALRQSEKLASHLRKERDFILEHTRDVLYYIDNQGYVYYVSAAVQELTGFTTDEWMGPFPAHLADTANNRRVIEETSETLRSGREFPPSDAEILHKDGHVLIAEINERVIIEGGKVIGIVGVARDITERRQAEYRLRQAAAVFENTREAIIITDPQRLITAVNRAFVEITGYSESEVRGRNAEFITANAEEHHFRDEVWSSVATAGRWTGEMWNRRKSGELFPAWVAISTIRDNRGSITNYVTLFSDLSQIRESEDKLDQLAHYDPLTRLPNRLLFHSRLAHALRAAERHRKQIAVIFIDLDHFKNVNDTLGHPAGDRLLEEIANRLSGSLRKEDTVAHLGGDEFVVILEHLQDLRYVVDIAHKLLAAIGRPFELDGEEAVISASIGIAIYPRDGTDVTRLIQNADTAMYRAKEMGRARFQFYTTELTEHAVERMALANALRNALRRNELVLYYQPQISLETGEVVGVEALLRWRHPERGLLLPKTFISLGEEIGLINDLGDWVLRNACLQAKEWRDAGATPFIMAVNLSVFQLAPSEHLVERVAQVLHDIPINPRSLEFEITESAIMRNAEEAVKIIKELKALGPRVAIDDFGTGYSSMSYLKYFALDKLKVDASFIHDIPQDPGDEAITEAIIALGHSLKLKVIAEGVETREQQIFLHDHGCDEMQGFLFSPPLSALDCARILIP